MFRQQQVCNRLHLFQRRRRSVVSNAAWRRRNHAHSRRRSARDDVTARRRLEGRGHGRCARLDRRERAAYTPGRRETGSCSFRLRGGRSFFLDDAQIFKQSTNQSIIFSVA